MDVLLTFAGHRDPFASSAVGEQRDGPVLDLVAHRHFDEVLVLETPGARENTRALVEELRRRDSALTVESEAVALDDPTDYTAILVRLRGLLARRLPSWGTANLYVSVASGTPQMHAAWVLLVAGGELPARVLHTRPPRFVSADKPAVQEVAFTGPAFPSIRPRQAPEAIAAPPEDVQRAVEEVGIVGAHPALRRVVEQAAHVATSDLPVLIGGETGTGKDLLARLIHRLSGRPRDRFVADNAATFKGDLIDSRLFGHEKGAFTGATERRLGLFERADRGTLFIDEIAELPLETQARLLRVLQDGSYERLGGARTLRSSARVIAATNRPLPSEIQAGRFREDLFYRLNVIELTLPPLRERRSDIPLLVHRFVEDLNNKEGRSVRISPDAMDQFRRAEWRGNVRELRNVVERTFVMTTQDIVESVDLGVGTPGVGGPAAFPEPHHGFDLREYLARVTEQLYARALEIAGGNQSEAARLLGVSSAAVSKHLRERRPPS